MSEDVTKACRDPSKLVPAFLDLLQKALFTAAEAGLRIQIIETYRSQDRQDWLYEQGRTRPGPVVTWTKHSKHTERIAADCIPLDERGRLIWDSKRPQWQQWGSIVEEAGLVWGGRWAKADFVHVQLG